MDPVTEIIDYYWEDDVQDHVSSDELIIKINTNYTHWSYYLDYR